MSYPTLPDGSIDLSKIPAGVPPPGVIPDLNGGQDLRVPTYVVCSIFLSWALVFVVIRVFVRLREKCFGIEDVFIVTSMFCILGYAGITFAVAKLSRHAWDSPASWFTDPSLYKSVFAQTVLVAIGVLIGKLSILLFYRRLFGADRKVRWAIYACAAFIIPFYLTLVVLSSIFCAPRADKSWAPTNLACSKNEKYALLQGVLNVFVDTYLLLLPMPSIVKLQMSKQKRMGLFAVFGTGILAIIASIIGAVYRFVLFQNKSDPLWHTAIIYIATVVESLAVIICACFPAVATFVKDWSAKGAKSYFGFEPLTSR